MEQNSLNQRVRIGGWLILLGILTWIAPFVDFLTLVTVAFTHIVKSPISLITSLIATVFAIFLLVLFIRRKKSFVRWEYIYLTYGVVVQAVMIPIAHTPMLGLYIAVAEFVVIGLYLLRSKRVKQTFVR